MKLNTSLTIGEVSKVNKKMGSHAVYDTDDGLLCFLTNKNIYDLNGKKIAEFEKRETVYIDEEKRCVRYYRCAESLFSSDGKYVYKDDKKIGRIEKRSFLVLAAILAGVLIASSGLFALYVGLSKTPGNAPKPVELTITDKSGEWGAEGEIDLFKGQLLRPGIKGEYWFNVANPNAVYLRYDITLDFEYENKDLEVPMQWTLKMNNVDVPLVKNGDIYTASEMIFVANSKQLFMLCFEWPFDGSDPQDTAVGIDGGDCACTITVTCQEYVPEG